MFFNSSNRPIQIVETVVFYFFLTTSLHVYAQDQLSYQLKSTQSLTVSSAWPDDGISTHSAELEDWSFYCQATYFFQQKNNFNSTYFGQNTLLNQKEGGGDKSYTLSATAYVGKRLWNGGEFYLNPEIFQGMPFNGQLVGLGGFQNGELQKGAFESPVYYTARAFIRQTFDISGSQESYSSSPNRVKGMGRPNRLILSFGKLASLDYFDDNTYSHDPRTQFQNFSVFSMGAFGYAADSKGFTFGGVVEWYQDNWIFKGARLALPLVPNTPKLDYSLTKDYVDQIEVTKLHQVAGQQGAIRALAYRQLAYMANYQDSLNESSKNKSTPEIVENRKHGTSSWGYGFNFEQALNREIGVFGRWSWHPGTTETQTLDISKSISVGTSIKGTYWSKPDDTFGVGYAINSISSSEINYLKQGGMTAFIGDGNINYKPETVFESYYNTPLNKQTNLTFDFQKIANPAYNSSRGPINIWGLRLHFEL